MNSKKKQSNKKCVLLVGPMKGGKTDSLCFEYDRALKAGMNPIAFGFNGTHRDAPTHVTARTGANMPAQFISEFSQDLIESLKASDHQAILIDEGQFFPKLRDVCEQLISAGKHIFIAMLNGDFALNPWDNVGELLPLVTHLEFKKAWCDGCNGIDGVRNHRITESTEKVSIGDGYQTLCVDCWEEIHPVTV